jgi:hypothetical protein
MNTEEIEKFLDAKLSGKEDYVRITFRKRDAIFGLFVRGHEDYSDLKSKNFWRIVPRSQFDAYRQSRNVNLAKIFSGSEFMRLAVYKESFD